MRISSTVTAFRAVSTFAGSVFAVSTFAAVSVFAGSAAGFGSSAKSKSSGSDPLAAAAGSSIMATVASAPSFADSFAVSAFAVSAFAVSAFAVSAFAVSAFAVSAFAVSAFAVSA